MGADIGVEGPEVQVGVLSIHRVGAPRGGAQGPAWNVAADRGGADEAAAQGRPGHSGWLPFRLELQPRRRPFDPKKPSGRGLSLHEKSKV